MTLRFIGYLSEHDLTIILMCSRWQHPAHFVFFWLSGGQSQIIGLLADIGDSLGLVSCKLLYLVQLVGGCLTDVSEDYIDGVLASLWFLFAVVTTLVSEVGTWIADDALQIKLEIFQCKPIITVFCH